MRVHTDFTVAALCLVIDQFCKDGVTFVESPGTNSGVFLFCFGLVCFLLLQLFFLLIFFFLSKTLIFCRLYLRA